MGSSPLVVSPFHVVVHGPMKRSTLATGSYSRRYVHLGYLFQSENPNVPLLRCLLWFSSKYTPCRNLPRKNQVLDSQTEIMVSLVQRMCSSLQTCFGDRCRLESTVTEKKGEKTQTVCDETFVKPAWNLWKFYIDKKWDFIKILTANYREWNNVVVNNAKGRWICSGIDNNSVHVLGSVWNMCTILRRNIGVNKITTGVPP